MRTQAQAFVDHVKASGLPSQVLLRDRDSKFQSNGFDEVLGASGLRVQQLTFRSPNLNAYIERFVQSIGQECLDKFICFGHEHLDYLAGEYLRYYHEERPHQAKGNEPLGKPSPLTVNDGPIVCQERLGGVLRHYYHHAA